MRKFVGRLVKCQEAVGTVLLGIFFLAITAQIGARYLEVSILWTEEVANYSFIWAVFMGASAMLYRRAHFSFTFLSDRFKGRKAALHRTFVSLILLFFTVAMAWYGVSVAHAFWNYNWITLPWVKMGYTWLCLPIAGVTMSAYNLLHIADDVRLALAREEAT